MCRHLCRREGFAHEHRITDDGLYTGLTLDGICQAEDFIFILGMIDDDKRVRRREDLFYL